MFWSDGADFVSQQFVFTIINYQMQISTSNQRKYQKDCNYQLVKYRIFAFFLLGLAIIGSSIFIFSNEDYSSSALRNLWSEKQIQATNFLPNVCLNVYSTVNQLKAKVEYLRDKEHFKCIKTKQYNLNPLYHFYHYDFYFMSIYEIVLPPCSLEQGIVIDKNTISQIDKMRVVAQWSLKNIKNLDKIYYSHQKLNPVEIIILSQLIGPLGELHTNYKYSKKCHEKIVKLHGLPNVQIIDKKQGESLSPFSIIISNFSNIFPIIKQSDFQQKYQIKKILTLVNQQQLSEIKKLKSNFIIKKIEISNQDCGNLIQTPNVQGAGYYQIRIKTALQTFDSKKRKRYPSTKSLPMIANFQSQWDQYKEKTAQYFQKRIQLYKGHEKDCLCMNKNRFNTKKVFSHYGTQYHFATKQQLAQWQKSRVVVEWIREKSKSNSSIYYQYYADGQHNNIFNIIQISKLIPEGKLFYHFNGQNNEQDQIRKRIQSQIKVKQIKNVFFTRNTSISTAISAQLVFTDNLNVIQALKNKINNSQVQVLAFFTFRNKESKRFLGFAYTDFHIVQAIIPVQQSCVGFQYIHFYQNGDKPHGFYELRKKGYVVYSFWGDQLSTLTPIRLVGYKQALHYVGVQSKLVNNFMFLQYFQIQPPIDKIYRLLQPTHKSDYFRLYMMTNYGGGYTDIKHLHSNWVKYYQKLYSNTEQKWVIGYIEVGTWGVACTIDHDKQNEPKCAEIREKYRQLFGACNYIFIKKNPLALSWWQQAHYWLGVKYQRIIQHPFHGIEGYGNDIKINDKIVKSQYPIIYGQFNGFLHRAQYKYRGHYYLDLPEVIARDYK